MSDKAFLKYLINEELYLIEEEKEEQVQPQVPSESEIEKVEKPKIETPVEKLTDPLETDQSAVAEPAEELIKRKHSGKAVLIIFDNTISDSMNPEEKAYLQKILSAVKLNIDDSDLVHVSNIGEYMLEGYQKVLSFSQKFNPANFDLYVINKLENAQSLIADDLTTISQSVELRKKLWGSLQKMFGV